MKDDEQIKTWLKEIKDDFDKAEKLQKDVMAKTSRDHSDSESNHETLDEMHGDVEDRLVKMEKLGFTTEEIIDLLKNTKEFDKNAEGLDSEEDDLESSDSDEDNTSDKRFSENPGERGRNKLNHEGNKIGINKMTKGDWSVVVLRNPAMETEEIGLADKILDKKKDWSVVEIEDFVNIAEAEEEDEPWQPPVELVRGKTGVFDIEELVKVVRAANARDVVTITIPGEFNFADYMVIATAKSQRHMAAIAADVKWIYKRKKSKDDKQCKLEGEKTDWYAMDLGNIVLHIFMPEVREMYDLETLWTVGAKFDPKCMEERDPYVFTVDELPWLKELEQASKNNDHSKREQASKNNDRSKQEFDKLGKSKGKIKQGYHSSGK